MRAGRTRLTALGCLIGLLAVVAVRAPGTSGSAGQRPPHGVHLAAAITALAPGHSRLDLQLVLPVHAQLAHRADPAETAPAALEVPLRVPVAAPARGPPGKPA